MSNPNPFVPKGSLLEQQSKRRFNLKVGVSCVLAVGIAGLLAMLIQGCKRDTGTDASQTPPDQDTNAPAMQADTNTPPPIDTNAAAMTAPVATNLPPPPVMTAPAPAPVETPAPTESASSEYAVVAGDTLAKIAKKNGVSLKALEAANPDVNPRRLKVRQKLVIPAGGAGAAPAASGAVDAGGAETGAATSYTVKSGDTLHRIARKFGSTVKAIEAENGLSTTKIKVGQKLRIPAKAESAAPLASPAPAAEPVLPAVPPAPTAAPAAPGAT